MISKILSKIAILNINCADYDFIVNGISKSEKVNLMQEADLIEKEKKRNCKGTYIIKL